MKKLVTLCMLLAVVLSAAGCGKQDAPKSFSVDCIRTLVDAGAFSEELEVLEGDIPFALYALADYSLTLKDLKECAAVRSAGATCEEAAVLIFEEDSQAATAKTALEDYLAAQIESNESYRPQEIPKLESAVVEVRGNTLLFAVPADPDAVNEILAQ